MVVEIFMRRRRVATPGGTCPFRGGRGRRRSRRLSRSTGRGRPGVQGGDLAEEPDPILVLGGHRGYEGSSPRWTRGVRGVRGFVPSGDTGGSGCARGRPSGASGVPVSGTVAGIVSAGMFLLFHSPAALPRPIYRLTGELSDMGGRHDREEFSPDVEFSSTYAENSTGEEKSSRSWKGYKSDIS